MICTHLSFAESFADALSISRSANLMADASRVTSALMLDGMTSNAEPLDATATVSERTSSRNSSSLISALPALRESGLKADPAFNAARSSLASTPGDVSARSMSRGAAAVRAPLLLPPLPPRALLRPFTEPLPEISEFPVVSLRLSTMIASLLKLAESPCILFLSGKYGVINEPDLIVMLPERSHSRKYLAIVSSSLMSMS